LPAYNSVVDLLDAQRGQTGGALSGDGIISTLSSALHNLTSYAGDSQSLTSLGIIFDKTGRLSLDRSTFNSASPDTVLNFLGDNLSSGFLKSATDVLNSIDDGAEGSLRDAMASVQRGITADDTAIANNQDRVNQLQDNLNAQMAAALIASLEQQVNYMTSLFSAMQTNTQALSK
jgi:flagellar capping protein FliD